MAYPGTTNFARGTLGKDMNPHANHVLMGEVIDKSVRDNIGKLSKQAHL